MTFQEWRNEQLKAPAFRAAYDALQPEYAFRNALTSARVDRGLTQAQLAMLLGMQRSALARLESGDSNPTLATLVKVAKALNISFEITPDARVEIREYEAVR